MKPVKLEGLPMAFVLDPPRRFRPGATLDTAAAQRAVERGDESDGRHVAWAAAGERHGESIRKLGISSGKN